MRFGERPRAIRIERDARSGEAGGQRRHGFHFVFTAEHATLEFEVIETVASARGFRESHNLRGSQRFLVAQPQPGVCLILC